MAAVGGVRRRRAITGQRPATRRPTGARPGRRGERRTSNSVGKASRGRSVRVRRGEVQRARGGGRSHPPAAAGRRRRCDVSTSDGRAGGARRRRPWAWCGSTPRRCEPGTNCIVPISSATSCSGSQQPSAWYSSSGSQYASSWCHGASRPPGGLRIMWLQQPRSVDVDIEQRRRVAPSVAVERRLQQLRVVELGHERLVTNGGLAASSIRPSSSDRPVRRGRRRWPGRRCARTAR